MVPIPVALFAALAIGAWAGATSSTTATTTSKAKKKKSVARTSASKAATKSTAKAPPKTAAATSTTSSKTTAAKRSTTARSKRPVAARHYAPQQPSPERYKEIQQALASKGYFNGEPDGTWGPASVDALKRFQHDQSLTEDGKIGSLSLIALGLGPKREPAADVEQKTPEQRTP